MSTWKWGIIDRDGKTIVEPKYTFLGEVSKEGWFEARLSDGSTFMDIRERTVIAGRFREVREYSEGLCGVELESGCGYIDWAGRLQIPAKFKSEHSFRNGRGLVRDTNNLFGYVDHSGAMVIPSRYSHAHDFSGGLALVCESGKDWGYIDIHGNYRIHPRYRHAEDFGEGLAFISREDEQGYIDQTGTLRIDGAGLKIGMQSFSEGLAAFERVGETKSGYMDREGRVRIPPAFDFASFFQEGLAEVEVEGKHGFIDRTGHFVVRPEYDDSHPFNEGLAGVEKDGQWGFIDASGRVRIPFRYYLVGWFVNGYARVAVETAE